jgi:signal transduction histidine kinase
MASGPRELCPELWEENLRLRSLVDLGRMLADPKEPFDRKLAQCVQALARLTQAESCSLMLVEDEELVVRAASQANLVGLTTPLDQASIATEVVCSGQAVYAKEVGDSDFAQVSRQGGKRSYRTGSLISLPLMEGGQVVGVLNLADKAGEPCFSSQDVETAQSIAQEVSRLINFSALHSSLQAAYEDLAEAQQAKDDLMHMIFHDMKAPIAAVKEVLGLLDPSFGLEPHEKSQYLALAREDLEILWRRTSNLLDLKRMDAGQYPLTPLPLNLADMAREAVERLAPLSSVHGVQMAVELLDQPRVNADEDLLERILSNLLINAAKHAGVNQEGGRVDLTVNIDKGRARVEVSDNGPGVDPDLGETVFERYVSGGEMQGSTGLGLYFCRRAAGLLDGEVGYYNTHRGAVFHLDLPLDKEA